MTMLKGERFPLSVPSNPQQNSKKNIKLRYLDRRNFDKDTGMPLKHTFQNPFPNWPIQLSKSGRVAGASSSCGARMPYAWWCVRCLDGPGNGVFFCFLGVDKMGTPFLVSSQKGQYTQTYRFCMCLCIYYYIYIYIIYIYGSCTYFYKHVIWVVKG